jgi:hypothetical protein
MTAARCSQPSPVRNWVTSAADSRSGPAGLKLRWTRSGAGAMSGRPRRQRRRACTPTSCWTHQASHPLAATAPPEASQLGMHPGCAVGAPRPVVDLADHPGELRVANRPRRGRPAEPGVEPRSRDSQDPAEPLDAVDVSVLGDEPEAADRIVSWAKYAAALRRISRSVRSSATSRRSRRSSSNSEPVTASGSAWRASSARWSATQLRNVVSFTPSRRATDARESSVDNASATASRRKSSGYFDGRPIRDPFPWPHARIRCPPNRVKARAGGGRSVRPELFGQRWEPLRAGALGARARQRR